MGPGGTRGNWEQARVELGWDWGVLGWNWEELEGTGMGSTCGRHRSPAPKGLQGAVPDPKAQGEAAPPKNPGLGPGSLQAAPRPDPAASPQAAKPTGRCRQQPVLVELAWPWLKIQHKTRGRARPSPGLQQEGSPRLAVPPPSAKTAEICSNRDPS